MISMPIKKMLAILAFASTPFIFIFGLIIIILKSGSSVPVQYPQTLAYAAPASSEAVLGTTTDERVKQVRKFFIKYNSPLELYASDVVAAADQYGMDHRLIPAIAMQESGACRVIPDNSYNCWGFGIYGGKVTKFNDYREGIYIVTKALATKYNDKGLVTPEEIMSVYTPSSNGSWAKSVNHFMEQL